MKDNFKLLNNIEMDLDKYEDLNIDKDKLYSVKEIGDIIENWLKKEMK